MGIWDELGAGGYSALNEVLMGLPDFLVKNIGGSKTYQGLKDFREKHKLASDIGGGAGFLGSLLIPGGAIAKGAGKLLSLGKLKNIGSLAKLAGGLTKAGEFMSGTSKGLKGLKGITNAAKRGALLSLEQSVPRALTGLDLSNPGEGISKGIQDIGSGIGLGAITGGTLGRLFDKLGGKTSEKLSDIGDDLYLRSAKVDSAKDLLAPFGGKKRAFRGRFSTPEDIKGLKKAAAEFGRKNKLHTPEGLQDLSESIHNRFAELGKNYDEGINKIKPSEIVKENTPVSPVYSFEDIHKAPQVDENIGKEIVGYRYGKAPESGRSYNTRENKYEPGVSMAKTGHLKETRSFAVDGLKDKNVKKYYYKGKIAGEGSDDEVVMDNLIQISKKEYDALLKNENIINTSNALAASNYGRKFRLIDNGWHLSDTKEDLYKEYLNQIVKHNPMKSMNNIGKISKNDLDHPEIKKLFDEYLGSDQAEVQKVLDDMFRKVNTFKGNAAQKGYLNNFINDSIGSNDPAKVIRGDVARAIKSVLSDKVESMSDMAPEAIAKLKSEYPLYKLFNEASKDSTSNLARVGGGSPTAEKLAINGLVNQLLPGAATGAGIGALMPSGDVSDPNTWLAKARNAAIGSALGAGASKLSSKGLSTIFQGLGKAAESDVIKEALSGKLIGKLSGALPSKNSEEAAQGVQAIQNTANPDDQKAIGVKLEEGIPEGQREQTKQEFTKQYKDTILKQLQYVYINYYKDDPQFAGMTFNDFAQQVKAKTDGFDPIKSSKLLFIDSPEQEAAYLQKYNIAQFLKNLDAESSLEKNAGIPGLFGGDIKDKESYNKLRDIMIQIASNGDITKMDSPSMIKMVDEDLKQIIGAKGMRKAALMGKLQSKYGVDFSDLESMGVL